MDFGTQTHGRIKEMNKGLVRREELLRALKEMEKSSFDPKDTKKREGQNLYRLYHFCPEKFYRIIGGTS